MTTLAVTGHIDLTEETVPLVRAALRELLGPYSGDLTGISCIAAGADSLFAEEVSAIGGRLIVVIPSLDYRSAVVRPEDAPVFDHLSETAVEVRTLPYETADRAAYEAANAELLKGADRLVAVWDGTPPSGRGGGTADLVEEAGRAGIPVDVVWPDGAARRG
ncbi:MULTISPECIES: hypothetical protein [unclassified Streptomyces]|uniref:hypothetical protein n=1 Tax=unclassified Streptomyces TaxID=2593676 RepID=UPI002E377638|nr:hypothetical protein [Streptomyces sp. NBC_01460]WSS29660.1 hypothetical protein OG770_27200 [Streptomyces sp. NBC_01185]